MSARERAEALWEAWVVDGVWDDQRMRRELESAILAAESAAYERAAKEADAEAADARAFLRRIHPSASEAVAKAESAIATARGIASRVRALAKKGGEG